MTPSDGDSVANLFEWHRTKLEAVASGATPGLPLGFPQLDEMTGGILGTLAVASPPGSGKTSFGVNVAANLATTRRAAVLIASPELPKELMMNRFCACVSGAKLEDVRSGRILNPKLAAQRDSWSTWALKAGEIVVVRGVAEDLSFAALRDRAVALRDTSGIERVLCIVDGLQTYADRFRKAGESERDALDRCTGELVDGWAREDVTSVLLSHMPKRSFKQLNQGVFFGSGRIEYRAHLVFVLRAPEAAAREGKAKFTVNVNITKNWHGPTGSVPLTFHAARCRFEGR